MKKILFLVILLIPELLLGQEEAWNNYLGQFENGTGFSSFEHGHCKKEHLLKRSHS